MLYNDKKEAQLGVQHFRIGGKPLIEAIASEARVPLSCLRAWLKIQDKLFRAAGALDASMIMGVKQRKMGEMLRTFSGQSMNHRNHCWGICIVTIKNSWKM